MLPAYVRQSFLRLEQLPLSREVAGILIAVGVPDHDYLAPPQPLQMAAIGGVGEKGGHRLGGIGQIRTRFK